jgi:hypothetical protein
MQEVGNRHGLKSEKRLTAAAKAQLFTDIIKALRAAREPIMQSKLWDVVRDEIRRNPLPYAQLLGIEATASKSKAKPKTFTGIMTSKGKGSQKQEVA